MINWKKLFGTKTRVGKPTKTLKFAEMTNKIERIEANNTPRYVDPASVTCGFICFPSSMSNLANEKLGHQALQTKLNYGSKSCG